MLLLKKLLFLTISLCLLSVALCDSIQGMQQVEATQQQQAIQQQQVIQQQQQQLHEQQLQQAQQQAQQAQQQAQQQQQQQDWNHGNGVTVSQNKTHCWEDSGATSCIFEVALKNCYDKTIYDITVVAGGNFNVQKPTDIWGVEKAGEGRFHFPGYLCQTGLGAGQTFSFGYINKCDTPAYLSTCDPKF